MKRLVVLIAILLPCSLYAQLFKPGYVVTTKGDTLKGYLFYNNSTFKNAGTVYFKKNLAQASKDTFNVATSTAFSINKVGDYRKYEVMMTEDGPGDVNFTFGKDTVKTKSIVFLKVVSTGKKLSLYDYKDKQKERFFISEKDSIPYELEYHEYHDAANQSGTVIDNDFRPMLQKLRFTYAPKDMELFNIIEVTAYKEDDLRKVIARLNK